MGREGQLPRLIALEVTRRCNLHCIHCRALAGAEGVPDELTTEEITGLFDEIAGRIRPIIILTGGEPLLRDDIFEIARYGTDLGFHMTLAPNGTLMDETVARRMIDAGIKRIGISLDGATPEVHDAFRDMPGAFAGAMKGIAAARAAGLPFQINTSVTALNVDELPKVHELARELGAVAHHIFMLVRVGRGRDLDAEVPPDRQEKVLNWLYERHPACRRRGNRRRHPRVPRRATLRLRLQHRSRPALRLPRPRLREHPREAVLGDLGRLAGASGPSGRREASGQVRGVRLPQGLRGVPGTGVRRDGRLPGRRAGVSLQAAPWTGLSGLT